jgi:hypothetical protein
MHYRRDLRRIALSLCAVLGLLFASGCGTTIKREATAQLLSSDAVDRTVSQIDFSALAGKKVYFDTQYIPNVKDAGFVNSEYIISSLRQQLITSNCLLQEKVDDADYVVEARIGTLGTDSHEVIMGLPANNFVSSAASVVPTLPQLPAIPEIALAKKNGQLAAAKIGVFAYDRRTKQPVWQSGIAQARSTARDTWIFGAGPFQRGSIYRGTQFAGSKIDLPLSEPEQAEIENDVSLAIYEEELRFARPAEAETAAAAAAEAPPSAEQPQADAKEGDPAAAESHVNSGPTPTPEAQPGPPADDAKTDVASTAASTEPHQTDSSTETDARQSSSTAQKNAIGPALARESRSELETEPRHLLGGGFLKIMSSGNRWIRLTDGDTIEPSSGD